MRKGRGLIERSVRIKEADFDKAAHLLTVDFSLQKRRAYERCHYEHNAQPACRGLHKGYKATDKGHTLSLVYSTHLRVMYGEAVRGFNRIALTEEVSLIRMLRIRLLYSDYSVYNEYLVNLINYDIVKLDILLLGKLVCKYKVKGVKLVV